MKLEYELVGDTAATDRFMSDDYFFMSRDGVGYENLNAALLVGMKSGESRADLLVRMISVESVEPTLQPTKID